MNIHFFGYQDSENHLRVTSQAVHAGWWLQLNLYWNRFKLPGLCQWHTSEHIPGLQHKSGACERPGSLHQCPGHGFGHACHAYAQVSASLFTRSNVSWTFGASPWVLCVLHGGNAQQLWELIGTISVCLLLVCMHVYVLLLYVEQKLHQIIHHAPHG
jgi:hypothetical protein